MLFNSLIFLYLFLPVSLVLIYLLPGLFRFISSRVANSSSKGINRTFPASERSLGFSNLLLLVVSLVFYAWGGVWCLAVLAGSMVLNYLAGLVIGNAAGKRARKFWFATGVILNLALLVFFKYSLFLVNNTNAITGLFGTEPWSAGSMILPLGLSFYTFKGIGYLITVKRQENPAERNFIRLALYIGLFPELIAGPIDRYGYLNTQIGKRSVSFEQFASGVRRFLLGLFKKVVISTPLAYVADHIINNPVDGLSTPLAWLGAISYMLQIYYDFSGYTDMAIGLGRMLGFELSENFNFPYISRSVREFWKRWHITLSTWLRDYLFLPIAYSTSRKLTKERYLGIRVDKLIYIYATMITFILCGFWHGAAWNFVVWGALHGIMLSLEHTAFGKWLSRTWQPFRHLYVILFMLVSLIVFRTTSLPQAFGYLGVMAGVNGTAADWGKFMEFFDREFIVMGSLAILGSTPILQNMLLRWQTWSATGSGRHPLFRALSPEIVSLIGLLFVLMLTTMRMISQTNTPFIYFQF
jgi:alginate O-acetyltransferase complex protein AlgI